MPTTEIIETADGSHSLFNPLLQETYHSRHGAIQESLHVYVRQGLEAVAHRVPDTLSVLEVGFGTGLNALLTWQWARDHQRKIQYITLEPFPLKRSVWTRLNYPEALGMQNEFRHLHESPFNSCQQADSNFSYLKVDTTIQQYDVAELRLQVIYFDAFAPEKQPELWKVDVFRKLLSAMSEEAHFVTYCAKGQVKRDLRDAGFTVKTLPGPPGKREMILALPAIPQNAVTISNT